MTEKYQHCIFVCSNYTAGTRNGLHFLFNSTNYKEIANIVSRYTNKEGVSVYFVVTDKHSIESVKEKEHFFKNVDILEGTVPENVISFNNSINNQINVMDVALLLLSRESLNSMQLKTYLFYIYCFYANNYGSFPFKEKCNFDKDIIGFRMINDEFDSYSDTQCFKCTKPTVIMSKFYNSEKGVELMINVLKIFYELKKYDVNVLNQKIDYYFKKRCTKYKTKNNKMRYRFVLTKKSIKMLNININDIN